MLEHGSWTAYLYTSCNISICYSLTNIKTSSQGKHALCPTFLSDDDLGLSFINTSTVKQLTGNAHHISIMRYLWLFNNSIMVPISGESMLLSVGKRDEPEKCSGPASPYKSSSSQ